MPSKLHISGPAALTIYAVIVDEDGLYWNGAALEAFDAAHWASYAVAIAAPNCPGHYQGDVPAGLPAGYYTVFFHQQVGAGPALTDPAGDEWRMGWNGTSLAPVLNARPDYDAVVPLGKPAETLADCLIAARAGAFGKWELDGVTWRFYAADATTVVRTFTLDDPDDTTRRS